MKVVTYDGRVFDGQESPVMIILSENDKKNLAALGTDCRSYSEYPDNMSSEEIRQWMRRSIAAVDDYPRQNETEDSNGTETPQT